MLLSVLACASCDEEPAPSSGTGNGGGTSGVPATDWRPAPGGPLPQFVEVGREAGFVHPLHTGSEGDYKNWILEVTGSGAAALDHDGDGDMDVLVLDGTGMTLEGTLEPIEGARARLYRNDGDLRFTDVTDEAGIDIRGYQLACAAADYDGDGDQDFVLAGYNCFHLMRNRGDGRFEDVTEAAGLGGQDWNMTCGLAWGDVNGDGLLDLFVANYVDQKRVVDEFMKEGKAPRSCEWRGLTVFCGPLGLYPQDNKLYFQRADHTFEDVTATNLHSEARYSFQVVFSDLDNDGDLDAYVPNDGVDNDVLVNDGSGYFVDRGLESGAATDGDFQRQGSMGTDVADYNHDGKMDVFITNFAHEHNTLYRNRTRTKGLPLFDDVSVLTNVSLQPQDRVAWGTKLFDFDNDGELDVFVACGHVYPEEEKFARAKSEYAQRNQLLVGQGPPRYRFREITDEGGPAMQIKRVWRGAVFADFDDDGDWDIFLTAQNDLPGLFRNDGGNRNSWVRLDLRGRPPLTSPAGARVTVHLGGNDRLHHELHLGSSYAGSNDPRLLIGVGKLERVPKIEIRWPDGTTTELTDVETRRTHVVRQ